MTVGDVSSRAGLTLGETERTLNALAADSEGTLQVACKQPCLMQACILAAWESAALLQCTTPHILWRILYSLNYVLRLRMSILSQIIAEHTIAEAMLLQRAPL